MTFPQDHQKNTTLFMTVYFLMSDTLIPCFIKLIPYFVKLTFPLWVLPYLCWLLAAKVIKVWRILVGLTVSVQPGMVFAVVKGNGRYLRGDEEDVLTHQFYDYASRRFMALAQLQEESRVVELESDSDVGLKFIKRSLPKGQVKGLTSSQRTLKQSSQRLIQLSEYQYESSPNQEVDCFLLFNFKIKSSKWKDPSIALIKVLNYARHHMSSDGYIVLGDYFEEGETNTYKTLFSGLLLRVVEEEDITKNIDFASKLMAKNHGQCEILELIQSRVNKVLGRVPAEEHRKFYLMILEKEVNVNHDTWPSSI